MGESGDSVAGLMTDLSDAVWRKFKDERQCVAVAENRLTSPKLGIRLDGM